MAFLVVVAALLRFQHVGDWSFAGDEIATFAEADSLLVGAPDPDHLTSDDRLPRMLPVSYGLLGLGYELIGRDEGGSRTMCAIFGVLGVPVTYLLLRTPLGRAGAATVALLVAFWPEHVSHSQQNRFYMFAWFFGSLAMLLGARALKERSRASMAFACAASVVAMLSHTVLLLVAVLIPVALAAGVVRESWRDRASAMAELRRMLPIPVATLLLMAAIGLFYIRPLMGTWNAGEAWGYGPLHSLAGTINSIGFPVVLCAVPGAVLALRWRDGQGPYWLCFAALVPVAALVLPTLVIHHPHYVFPLTLGVFVCVGFLVQWAAEAVGAGRHRMVPVALAAVLPLLGLPGLVSYFKDGGREDYRGVARYLAENWREGDRVLTHSPALVRFYAREIHPVDGLRGWDLDAIRRGASSGARSWIVLRTNRGGIPEPVRTWLGENCRWPLLATKPRLDYSDHRIYVFLHAGTP